jgi:hypothetical protein
MKMNHHSNECSGYCKACGTIHMLGQGKALIFAQELIQTLQSTGRIDFECSNASADPKLSLDYLWGTARGQMFGVLECMTQSKQTVFLKAFSCQYNGIWEVPGWSAPLFDVESYYNLVIPADKQIKDLGKELIHMEPNSPEHQELKAQRKQISQKLMKDLHNLYRLHNFNKQTASLYEAFVEDRGIPTGCGDCCAPKLLNEAAQKGYTPISLSEFYLGKENKSNTRVNGQFYGSCKEKCQPILGFMLCKGETNE